ncbi:hypothetical protein ASG87_12610 [Frateuria sp. Soil773]|uniref:YceI family protein n=1 Tax=Frateuria sp. Soil773 TaxID=1736407 RepID=UPI0006FE76C1|nr:YceI family protein [Frateuria sp. Soil773]KRF00533.1 hypothetical protein ASG87_12610 [Frateuria sp. Soil773]
MRRIRVALLGLAGLLLAAGPACGTDYRIDSSRSQADFGVRLLWLHTVNGRFDRLAGDIHVDPQGMAQVDAHIAVESLAMSSARVRRWVLAPEFFDSARYPSIRFLSAPLPFATLARGGALDGRLSLRGVTRPVSFELLPARCADGDAQPCLIRVHGQLSRSAFGMDSHRTALSDQVDLDLLIVLDPATR